MRIRIAWCPLLLAACGEASATGDTTGDVASATTDASTSAAPGTSSSADADESGSSVGMTQDASSGAASDTSSGTDTGAVDEGCSPRDPPLDLPAATWEPVAADLGAA